MPYGNRKSSHKNAHPCSPIGTFCVRLHILQYPLLLRADNEGPDQPVLMRRLIWAFVDRKLHKGPFLALFITNETNTTMR